MKKLLALLLVCGLLFSFAACGSGSDADNDTNDVESTVNSTDDTESVESNVIIDLGDDTTSMGDGPVVSGTPRPLPGK
jgi:hypothetical protein